MRRTISLLTAGAVLGASGAAIAKDPAGDHDLPDRIPIVLQASTSTATFATFVVMPNGMDGSEVSVEPLRELRPYRLVRPEFD